jgi:phenylalanine-4-hydroxylase
MVCDINFKCYLGCLAELLLQELQTRKNIVFLSGQPIPRIKYTPEEVATWKTIYRALTKLYDKYACAEFKANWKELETLAGYRYNKTS